MHPARTTPAQTLAVLEAYYGAKDALTAWVRDAHNRLQTKANKNPDLAEWAYQQQQRLEVLTTFREIADHALQLLYVQATGQAADNAGMQAEAYERRRLSLSTVLEWLEYDASLSELNEVTHYLSDSRTKLRMVAHLSPDELQSLLSHGNRSTHAPATGGRDTGAVRGTAGQGTGARTSPGQEGQTDPPG